MQTNPTDFLLCWLFGEIITYEYYGGGYGNFSFKTKFDDLPFAMGSNSATTYYLKKNSKNKKNKYLKYVLSTPTEGNFICFKIGTISQLLLEEMEVYEHTKNTGDATYLVKGILKEGFEFSGSYIESAATNIISGKSDIKKINKYK